jgi:biopolymer transport protein ExbB
MFTQLHPVLLQANSAVKPSIDVFELLLKGGVVMIPLALLSLAALVLIIERMLFFGKNLKYPEAVFREFLSRMLNSDRKGAAAICEKERNSWGRVFTFATLRGTGTAEADTLMEEAAEVEIARLEKGLNYLSIIAGVAPLLGFIGTIVGVITIFFDISVSQDISISVISEGLYKKMVTSATGLVIGIIAYSAFHLFQNQIDQFVNAIREQSLHMKTALQSKEA